MNFSIHKVFFVVVFLLLGMAESYATHIRAADINVIRLEQASLRFRIILTAYTDAGAPQNVLFGAGVFDFGDGSDPIFVPRDMTDPRVISFVEEVDTLGNEIEFNQFIFEHTFPAGFTSYTVSYLEQNRNEGILNVGNSVNTPFYVETTIIIDDAIGGPNNTPLFTVPPIDFGCTNVRFEHNPGATDLATEGDSLAYRVVIPQQDRGIDVSGYLDPADPSLSFIMEDGNPPATFSIDAFDGTVLWNTPGIQGEYNIAFAVEEWRQFNGQFTLLSETIRDMQIIVEECENNPPDLIVPNDTCIEAGTELVLDIMADDVDGDLVRIAGFGGPFEAGNDATLTPFDSLQPVVASAEFRWQTACSNVRLRPFQATFRATDNGAPNLVDFETWNITVVAPAPVLDTAFFAPPGAQVLSEGNLVTSPGRSIALEWEPYTFCGSDAQSLVIYRRIDSFEFEPGCDLIGIPAGSGYMPIDTVGINEVNYLDTNRGELLNFGANYCYRMVALFAEPGGFAESFASNELCDLVEATAPVITNVDVLVTDQTDGEIEIRWIPPLEFDSGQFTPPFTYSVLRATGFSGNANLELIADQISDTSVIDVGLNTEAGPFNYRIAAFDASGAALDTSNIASSVFLTPIPFTAGIQLDWEAQVPRTNQAQSLPFHFIFRDNADPNDLTSIILIDSVNVIEDGFTYLDEGQFNGVELSDQIEYSYFVRTIGTYGNDTLPSLDSLVNNSQIVSLTPNDSIPPCPPLDFGFSTGTLPNCDDFLAQTPCGETVFENILEWTLNDADTCTDAAVRFNIFFSGDDMAGEFELIATVPGVDGLNTFVHEQVGTRAGCYQISSIDRGNNESERSVPICVENCPQYNLPNVITPGGNETSPLGLVNDLFEPIFRDQLCPRFVEEVELTVVNRWGKEVFSYNSRDFTSDDRLNINWDGTDNNGNELASGVYFYLAEVEFRTIEPELIPLLEAEPNNMEPAQMISEIKGWVNILRGEPDLRTGEQ